jgi:predicted O-methyltransferase YrrM
MILLLGSKLTPELLRIHEAVRAFADVRIVVDSLSGVSDPGVDSAAVDESCIVHVPNAELTQHEGIMGRISELPVISAWTRALAWLERERPEVEHVWFIEDDVAFSPDGFRQFLRVAEGMEADLLATDIFERHEQPDWHFWWDVESWFEQPRGAFQPLCRLSTRLLRKIFEFREKHGHYLFHELLFPSLVVREGMSMLDMRKHAFLGRFIGAYQFRPIIESYHPGICHPVKHPGLHQVMMEQPDPLFRRRAFAHCDGWAILSEDYAFLERFAQEMGLRRVVEFGPGDSTLAFLDAGVEGIISYEHDECWLEQAKRKFLGMPEVRLEFCDEDSLPELNSLEEAPDFVLVDGPSYRAGQERSRWKQCLWALETCGAFILHDAKRGGEQATLTAMRERGLRVMEIPTRKGMALVVDPARKPEMLKFCERYAEDLKLDPAPYWWAEGEFFDWCAVITEKERPRKILDVGTRGGGHLPWLVQRLFQHEETELHLVDQYSDHEEMRDRLQGWVDARGLAERIDLYEGEPEEVLAWMIAEDGYWQSFDFIFVRRRDHDSHLLADACAAWSLLKPGGIMVLEPTPAAEDGNGREAMDAFARVYGGRLLVLHHRSCMLVRKLV